MHRFMILFIALLGLASCAGDAKWEPDGAPQAVELAKTSHYRTSNPPTLSLLTAVNAETGNSGHTALMIDASERVIFDPAGSFKHPQMPRVDDVFYGMTDRAVNVFIDYYARGTWKVVRQDLRVPRAAAEQALELARAHGSVSKAFCANSTSKLLSQVQGFEQIHSVMFPTSLMKQFASFEGVKTSTYHDMKFNSRGQLVAANN